MTTETSANGSREHASFGFRDVEVGAKQGMVDAVFHKVASRYDLMNDLMSAGLHRVWKDAMVSWLAPPSNRDFEVLDVAGGTGDVSFRIIDRSRGRAHAIVCDINASMLEVGRERAAKRGLAEKVEFVEGNAEELPFESGRFDAYTIAFGIRNVPRIELALKEAYRVLKPGGRFLCLEFASVDVPGLDRIYDLYSFHMIPEMGRLVAGDAESYRYLVESIRRFPHQERFAEMIRRAGFASVSYRNFTGGIAAIHSGWKI
ncbi:bifunctional demethylmenaquinone methyltransferase/2-methoxy-6-polyprenyl-1,4-benzoquinol methylase UbiE [Kaistia algarum]|uniref:bifunctional demethylmenaquinone methyltransferase/2-methoxy-6-polyprenyl-1,4-benzoquinol methylase UbiE n=1 Tax=Kaistia algarum TaxID=2083279 RepID=UPI000CE78A40|nr:bifunctional demethylmenaquinone methyltransferase/2-methoxy-6-polyprenyl-1,4-benzoquinol methylase UbiE [Kaistia algarum]MCX5513584.1 bifunctional demethylmenaquinone methyltransferase/2-methoxy-6-polyprenyl-1,4-benzoquinol methylase UbiE [Kaistia algarum]PPE77643.1 bifunctional demethylmenaquinone methyltransferase/2-methoxy-6-polyprenyl-1,4-benzoquinol methylase UbiE [Kaistia algarum]